MLARVTCCGDKNKFRAASRTVTADDMPAILPGSILNLDQSSKFCDMTRTKVTAVGLFPAVTG